MSSLSTWVTVTLIALIVEASAAQQPVSGSADADKQLLLQFRNAIDNWSVFKNASGFVGWDDSISMCLWGGVACSQAGRVTKLQLGCEHCNVKASGSLLPSLALLDQLQELRLDRNWFNGTLPPAYAYGFPSLVRMRLDFNSLTGVIPPDWGQPGAFPSLQFLNLGGNQLKGLLPEVGLGALSKLKTIGLQWNMLHGLVPDSWRNLRAQTVWLRPGNYQLCGSTPVNATFELCKEVDGKCEDLHNLGAVCDLEVPATPRMMPPPTANPTMLEAVLRVEGANIIPFTANNLNIFVSAVVAQLPNVTARDIVISQVVPVVSLNGSASQSSGRQLGTPAAWPLPAWGWAPPLPRQDGNQGQVPGYAVDASAGGSQFSSAVTIVGGRRLMASPTGGQLSRGLHVMRSSRRVLADAAAASPSAPVVAPIKRPPKPALRGPGYTTAPAVNVIIGGDTEPQRQGDWVDNPAPGNPVAAPMLSAMPVGYATAPAGFVSPPLGADPPLAPRPYGTPVPGGVLIGADISMQIRTIVNGNVSQAEDMVADMAESATFLARLRQAGLGVAHVLLVSCEPLDPEELPVRLRPPKYNVSLPVQGGIPTSSATAGPSHFPIGITVGVVLAFGGFLLAVIGVTALLITRKKRLHPSASPGRSLNEAQSTDVLKQAGGSGGLDGKVSGAATSTGTPSHQHFGGRDSLRTLHSDMEGSGGQLLGQRSSDLRAMSDATLIARLGNEHTAGPALQQIAERQAMSMQASSSGHPNAMHGWAGADKLGKQGSSIELPSMPWSDWEVPGDQIEICKRPDGSDWELGAGAFGKVFKALRGGVQVVAVKILHDAEVGSMNFVREIAILKGCRHSNIVQFQGACVSGSKTMLVMEFVEGGDLWRNLQRPGTRVGNWRLHGRKVALDIARGLCFLHAHSIVLFDLKSHNVLLTRDGTAKIADVGLAKVLTQGYVSKLDEVAGTFAWAAPELLMGGRCSEKVDIFSFGVVLWELATTERPQRGAMRDVRVPEEVPEEVAQLMNECLSYDPKMRPSAKEIYERLSAVQSSGGGSSAQSAPSSAPQSSAPEASAAGAGAAPGMPETQDEATVSSLYRELGMAQGPHKSPTPLGITRLPIKSAFDMSE